MKPVHSLLCLLFSVAILTGCGGGKPEADLVIVDAVVQIDGKPAADIQVTMMPDITAKNDGPASIGTSDSTGKITFQTMKSKRDGLVVGAHKATAFDLKEDRPPQGQAQKHPSRISGAYATESGGLKVQVVDGQKLILNFKSK